MASVAPAAVPRASVSVFCQCVSQHGGVCVCVCVCVCVRGVRACGACVRVCVYAFFIIILFWSCTQCTVHILVTLGAFYHGRELCVCACVYAFFLFCFLIMCLMYCAYTGNFRSILSWARAGRKQTLSRSHYHREIFFLSPPPPPAPSLSLRKRQETIFACHK